MKKPKRKIRQLVIHCAATYPSMDIDAKWIDRVHRKRGFDMIGYHFFIKRDGTVEPGRAVNRSGAHVKGHNKQSIGICLAGGLQEGGDTEDQDAWQDNFTPDQMRSLRETIAMLREQYPGAEILGHRDFPGVGKACPCFDVKSWWISQQDDSELIPSNNRIDN